MTKAEREALLAGAKGCLDNRLSNARDHLRSAVEAGDMTAKERHLNFAIASLNDAQAFLELARANSQGEP